MSAESITSSRFRFSRCFGVLFACLLMAVSAMPTAAYAQCEQAPNASNNLSDLASDIRAKILDFINQEMDFIDEDLTNTATYEMLLRLYEFDTNIRAGLSSWWQNDFLPALMDMTKQLSAAPMDQSRQLGSLVDAELLNEGIAAKQHAQVEARRRYVPNELTCQVDSMMRPNAGCGGLPAGCGPSKVERMANAMTMGYAKEDMVRRNNAIGTTADKGQAVELNKLWSDFCTTYYDPARGNQGCGTLPAAPAITRQKHLSLPEILWGDKLTYDMSVAENRKIFIDVQRFMLSPTSMDPIPEQALNTAQGREQMLYRRSRNARLNTVYNVVGQMLSERASGSEINTSALRLAGGVPAANTYTGPNGVSYRELMEALTKDRFHNPEYIVRMVNAPEEIVREQGSINALKLQQMGDIYRRMEEMVVMEASVFAAELDFKKPGEGREGEPDE
ncbi:MAG: hypothetical protein ACAH80_03895 [Alphaproteobacteria bacterium]